MGHGKLKKFAENLGFHCLLQPEASSVLDKKPGSKELLLKDHPIKGNWGAQMFGNSNPIVLELGCGGGEYTIALAQRHPEINYIGVDIKGARLWKGAKYATEHALPNVAFLRTRIEFITAFFGAGEVSEICLSSPMFLSRYRSFLRPGGIVHLKTDSRFLHEYTMAVVMANDLKVLVSSTDIYHDGTHILETSLRDPSHLRWAPPSYVAEGGHSFQDVSPSMIDINEVIGVQTFYEKMFLEMGLPITSMAFVIDHSGDYVYPTDFDPAYWREQEGPRRSFSHQPAAK